LTTNGLINLAENSRIINALDGISFSINDAFTLGMWPEIAENIKRARRIKETVSLSCILTHTNCDQLDHILAFAKTHAIGIYFTPVINPSLPMQHNVQKAIQRLIMAKKNGYPVIDSFTYLRGLNKKNPKKNCYAGRLFFAVNTNGDLYPCLNFIGSNQCIMGNLLQPNFRFDTIRSTPPCNQCIWNCHEEANYLFSFQPEAFINLFKSSYGRQALF
jgi:MoaA/NifB/PqqE/SkfB family radical SAM enzyme